MAGEEACIRKGWFCAIAEFSGMRVHVRSPAQLVTPGTALSVNLVRDLEVCVKCFICP